VCWCCSVLLWIATGRAPVVVDQCVRLPETRPHQQAADEDGSGELDIEEFCSKLGPHLGANLTKQQVMQLFLKIDADAGGTVDWDEFTNFMFLEKAQQAAGEGAAENWRLFPQEFRDTNEQSCYHRDQVDRLYYVSQVDKYITCGRDGSFRWVCAAVRIAVLCLIFWAE